MFSGEFSYFSIDILEMRYFERTNHNNHILIQNNSELFHSEKWILMIYFELWQVEDDIYKLCIHTLAKSFMKIINNTLTWAQPGSSKYQKSYIFFLFCFLFSFPVCFLLCVFFFLINFFFLLIVRRLCTSMCFFLST